MDTKEGDEHARAVERRTVVEEKIRHDVREMLEVLKADIPGFFAREAKRRFVATPDFADRLDAASIAKLKKDVQAAAERTAREVTAALEPRELWTWDSKTPLPESPKNLDAQPRVSGVLAQIGADLAAVLSRHNVPDAATAKDSYKLPSYFVAGRFMKSLVESYWRNLQELVELEHIIDETQNHDRRERNASRWDKA